MESKDVMLVKVDMLAGIVESKGSEYISNIHYTYYLNGKNDSCTYIHNIVYTGNS